MAVYLDRAPSVTACVSFALCKVVLFVFVWIEHRVVPSCPRNKFADLAYAMHLSWVSFWLFEVLLGRSTLRKEIGVIDKSECKDSVVQRSACLLVVRR